MKKIIFATIFLILSSIHSFAQLRVNNPLDVQNVYNYYLYHSNNDDSPSKNSVEGNPYFTPLINGYRYNAFRDVIVNAENDILQLDNVELGEYLFVRKSFFPRWKKSPTSGYLIKLDEATFLRVRKKIHENYNPKQLNKSKAKFELIFEYYALIDGQIKQIKENKNDKNHLLLQVGFIHSQLNKYSNGELQNRNSVYYGLGQTMSFKKNYDLRATAFFAKNGGFNFYNDQNDSGKKIIVYNVLGVEMLILKKINRWQIFGGARSSLALKREQRLASRRKYGIRFQDVYSSLKDDLKEFLPLSFPVGFSYEFAEDLNLEIKYIKGISKVNKAQTNEKDVFLNALQIGFLYQL